MKRHYEPPAITRSIPIDLNAPIKIIRPGEDRDGAGWVTVPLYGDDHPRKAVHREILRKINERHPAD